jgi:argininosuccinate lyase
MFVYVNKVPHTSAADATFSPEHDGGIAITGVGYCRDMLVLIGEVLETLVVDKERMRAGFTRSWTTTSNLADIIVRETGLPFRTAHSVVGRLVRNCIQQDVLPAGVRSAHVDAAAREVIGRPLELSDQQVHDALDPWRFIETRVTEGSANPRIVREALDDARARLDVERRWLDDFTEQQTQASEKLDQAITAIVG